MTQAEALDRIQGDLLRACPDVVGIIAFGSFARGEDWRDVDVLVVLPTLRNDPAGWVETAHALRQAIDLPRVEVIPYSQPGFINGLRNHSPFLLDVAVDGIVLHDRANLAEAVASVKRDLQERGIHRLRPGSWRFPVQLSLGGWADRLRRVAAVAGRLEPHVARARYVIEDAEGEKWWVPADQYSDSDSATALNETREAIRIVHDFVDWWFAPER